MSKTLELLLQLEGLMLVKRGLQLAGPQAGAFGVEYLDTKIIKLRRQVPGQVLSRFDKVARRYADPIAAWADGVCQGCHESLSARFRQPFANSSQIPQCEHCGRLLFAAQDAPDYVP